MARDAEVDSCGCGLEPVGLPPHQEHRSSYRFLQSGSSEHQNASVVNTRLDSASPRSRQSRCAEVESGRRGRSRSYLPGWPTRRGRMAQGNGKGVPLAQRLRDLREHTWPDVTLTQARLARALSAEIKIAPATLASWESRSDPKTPSTARLNAYARFFATRRSLEGGPHLLRLDDLNEDEKRAVPRARRGTARSPARCPRGRTGGGAAACLNGFRRPGACRHHLPGGADRLARGPLADSDDPNFTRAAQVRRHRRAHRAVRAHPCTEPTMPVFHRLPSDLAADRPAESHGPARRHWLEPHCAAYPVRTEETADRADRGRTTPAGEVFRVQEGRGPRRADLLPGDRGVRRQDRGPRGSRA